MVPMQDFVHPQYVMLLFFPEALGDSWTLTRGCVSFRSVTVSPMKILRILMVKGEGGTAMISHWLSGWPKKVQSLYHLASPDSKTLMPTKIDYGKRNGTLLLTSLLEDLVAAGDQ